MSLLGETRLTQNQIDYEGTGRQTLLVPVVLIRHAHAGDRVGESGDRLARRLSPRGHRQAERLVELVRPWSPQRVLSSPYVRCVETVDPLSASLGLSTEISQSLAEGAWFEALTLVRSLLDDKVALCTHGDVISEILITLADEDRLDLGPHPRQARGSAWVLESHGQRLIKATYISPGI